MRQQQLQEIGAVLDVALQAAMVGTAATGDEAATTADNAAAAADDANKATDEVPAVDNATVDGAPAAATADNAPAAMISK